jgi:hypothetical protein
MEKNDTEGMENDLPFQFPEVLWKEDQLWSGTVPEGVISAVFIVILPQGIETILMRCPQDRERCS